mgnify:CR=1 FL=1
MQIDFHHAVTYVAARFAGFGHDEAAVVAHAAQHVDDATSDRRVVFDNRAMYTRIASAHKNFDPHNLDELESHLVWLPFHFLPGNGGAKAGTDPTGTFIDKIRCLPGHRSPVAQDMIEATIQVRHKPNALHRLGITMHVYADTWSHQGFAGVLHRVNAVNHMEDIGSSRAFGPTWLGDIMGDLVPPLGHGQARIFPDMPFLRWAYENGRGEAIERNNPADFREAADAMCRAMQRFRAAPETGIPASDLERIGALFTRRDTTTVKADKRHRIWLAAIGAGEFSFGAGVLTYAEEGPASWRAQALGTSEERADYPYAPAFLASHWKRFHDALQEHRLTLLHDILPKYGICAG